MKIDCELDNATREHGHSSPLESSGCGLIAAGGWASKAVWSLKFFMVLGLSLNQVISVPSALLSTIGLPHVAGSAPARFDATAVATSNDEKPSRALLENQLSASLPRHPYTPLVAFLKFHKVAGATVATIFRNACPTHLPPHYWNVGRCPAQPHGHASLVQYRRHGAAGMSACLQHNNTHPVVLATILRDPVDRILSSLHFFYGGRYMRWAKSEDERALATLLSTSRSLPSSSRRSIRGAPSSSQQTRRRMSSASTNEGEGEGTGKLITPDLINHLVRESANHWRQPLNEYVDTLARGTGKQDSYARDTVAAAKNLARDFQVVGLTRDVPGFAVLLALHMHWPLEAVCLYSSHMNYNRTSTAQLSPSMLAYLKEAVKEDAAVYAAAEATYAAQVAAAGPNFTTLRAQFVSPAFQARCAARQKAIAQAKRAHGGKSIEGC